MNMLLPELSDSNFITNVMYERRNSIFVCILTDIRLLSAQWQIKAMHALTGLENQNGKI